MTTNPAPPQPEQAPPPRPAYFGIGCITAIAGFMGGGMIAVLIAKVVGGLSRCAADAETGAPCNWGAYWIRGAVVGLVLLPSVSIYLLKRGRQRARNPEQG